MEGCLVRAEVHFDVLSSQPLPKIHHIPDICERDNLLSFNGFQDPRDQLVEVLVKLVNPALVEALAGGHASGSQLLPGGIHDCYRRAVDNPLGTDVHV